MISVSMGELINIAEELGYYKNYPISDVLNDYLLHKHNIVLKTDVPGYQLLFNSMDEELIFRIKFSHILS